MNLEMSGKCLGVFFNIAQFLTKNIIKQQAHNELKRRKLPAGDMAGFQSEILP